MKHTFTSPARIVIDNEAAICMGKYDKGTAGNRHVARRYHYVQQGTALQEHKFEWIGTKHQLADPLTKPGSEKNALNYRNIMFICMDSFLSNMNSNFSLLYTRGVGNIILIHY